MQITLDIDTEKFDGVSALIAKLKNVSGSGANKELKELLEKEEETAVSSLLKTMSDVLTTELDQRTNFVKEQRQRLSNWFGEEEDD